ncbi:MAG: lysophospholipid acyltransferase family protein [Deltaproteobacteria bacterium]|nr:lysophospholipid acyltransferase family protein [Deltaproteobacteria bacterium]
MLVSESFSRDILRLIIWYPFRYFIRALPIGMGFKVMRMLGKLHSAASGINPVIADNLTSAFGKGMGEEKIKGIIRRYRENHYVNQLQIFLFPRLNKKNLERHHTFAGIEHLNKALEGKRGCILLHTHFGPAQLPLCALGVLGYKVIQLGLPTDEGLSFIGKNVAFRLRVKYESMIPATILPADKFLRPVFEALKNNGVLMITGDGAGGGKLIGKYVYVPFMGAMTRFPVGAFNIADKTKSPILPMFTVLGEDGKYRSVIHPPISLKADATDEEKVSGFASVFEGHLKQQPYHWHFWDELHERRLR